MSDNIFSSESLTKEIIAIGNKSIEQLRMEYLSWEDARSANIERGNEKAENYCLAMMQAITQLVAKAEATEKRDVALIEIDEASRELGEVIGRYIRDTGE